MSQNNALAFFEGAAPAKREDFAKALTTTVNAAKSDMSGADGIPLLRLTKVGDWVFGASSDPVEEGARYVINPATIMTGFIAWKDGKPAEERMVPVGQVVNKADLPDAKETFGVNTSGPNSGKPVTWDAQTQFDLMCVEGEDAGMVLRYKAVSYGGRRAASGLIEEIAKRISSPNGYTDIIPKIELETDSYDHKDYGEIQTPVFEIVGWMEPAEAAGGEQEEVETEVVNTEDVPDDAEEADVAPPKPRRRRRRKKKAA